MVAELPTGLFADEDMGVVVLLTGAPTAEAVFRGLQPGTLCELRESAFTRWLKGSTTVLNAELLESAGHSASQRVGWV